MFKVGSQLFAREGPRVVGKLARLGPGIFLDLKFHDIPSTVAGAIWSGVRLPGVRLLTIHALGGFAMMRAAAKAAQGAAKPGKKGRAKVLGVTILTSLDALALRQVGIRGSARTRALELAKLAQRAGLDGAVCSAWEAPAIRRACGRNFLIVVPGVRPGAARREDQARAATPGEAIQAGADYVVVGRPITAARNPVAATEAILREMAVV